MKKPTKRQQLYADNIIKVMRGWKLGKQIQIKYRSLPVWVDTDLLKKIDDSAVQYRIKP